MDREELIKDIEKQMREPRNEYVVLWFSEAEYVLELLKEQDTVEHACDILRANGWTETEPICSECDAIHVVRCKECKFREECMEKAMYDPDWFCADGEQRTEV